MILDRIKILPFILILLLSSVAQTQEVCVEKGIASYYANFFEGRRTANGEIFDQEKLTAAHLELPFGSLVKVTNLNNLRTVIVRINDRGPYHKKRCIDLSSAAARKIGILKKGIVPVLIECLFIPQSPLKYRH